LGGFFKDAFRAVLCDGSVHPLHIDMPQDVLRLLILKDDGQAIDSDKIRQVVYNGMSW
jgi:hypothetical protein